MVLLCARRLAGLLISPLEVVEFVVDRYVDNSPTN